jgi:CRP-like cAMP-binding protein
MKKNEKSAACISIVPEAPRRKSSGIFEIDRGRPQRPPEPQPRTTPGIADRHSAYLRAVAPRFGPVEDGMLAGLYPLMRVVRLERGGHFLKAGDVAHSFGWIVRGLVREYYVSQNGRQHNRAFCWEGLPFGSLVDLISSEPPITYIEAVEDVEALVMEWGDFEALCNRDPRWHVYARRCTEFLLVTKIRREHDLLTLDAEARYQRLLERAPGIEARVPLYHLASYLGMRHEHLSRVRRKRSEATESE